MTFGAASLGSVTNHISNYEVSSNLLDKTSVSGGKLVQFGTRRYNRGLLLTCAARKGKDEHEITVNSYNSDDQSLTISKNGSKSNDSVDETVSSSLYLSEVQSQHARVLGNHGNLLDKLKAVHMHALAMEQWNASRIKLCHRQHVMSAANLIHYLALRSLDVDQLKDDLSSVGLLNLETINPYVISSLSAGIQMLENLKSNSLDSEKKPKHKSSEFTITMMKNKFNSNRDFLIGPPQNEKTHIMVTVGEEAVSNEAFISDILKAGTTIVRINCAHGDMSIWSEIIRRVKVNSQMLEKPCRILMDLAGPKLRTGEMKPGPCVVKISPKKGPTGTVVSPAQIWLTQEDSGAPPPHVSPDSVLYVDSQDFLTQLETGDTIRFVDARGKQRSIKISKKYPVFNGVGFMADCKQTAYVEIGTELHIKSNKKKSTSGFVVNVPPTESFVRLKIGDLLVITREHEHSSSSKTGTPKITCSSGYLFDSVKPGEPIAFDDGKIRGIVKGTSMSEIVVSITHAGPRGTKLGAEKSINIPESKIRYKGLTSKDIVDLDFVGTHADIAGISFVRNVNDIVVLRQELEKRKLKDLGIVLKIETKDGVQNLPVMLLEAMKLPNPLGVMIARGDLAVECGWEMMADIQEEILSICSAAHVPVIWATQVLETLVKTGVPTRAEITDVACGRRASCIMLNKGKHILEAIATLDTMLKSRCSTKVKPEVRPFVLSNHLF